MSNFYFTFYNSVNTKLNDVGDIHMTSSVFSDWLRERTSPLDVMHGEGLVFSLRKVDRELLNSFLNLSESAIQERNTGSCGFEVINKGDGFWPAGDDLFYWELEAINKEIDRLLRNFVDDNFFFSLVEDVVDCRKVQSIRSYSKFEHNKARHRA